MTMRRTRTVAGTWLRRTLLAGLVLVVALGGLGWWAHQHLAGALTRLPDVFAGLPDRPARATGAASNALNILLVVTGAPTGGGTTRLAWTAGHQPLESVLVVHVDADRVGMSMLALPLADPVPAEGSSVAAAAAAGRSRLVRAVESMTDLRVDHLAVLEWSALASLVERAGGVDLEVPGGTPGWAPGVRRIDATGAWQFITSFPGPAPGAVGRAQRLEYLLRLVLEAQLHQEMARKPWQLFGFLDTIVHGLAVDAGWEVGELRSLALELRGLRSWAIRFIVVPTGPTGGSAVHPDAPSLWAAVRADRVDVWLAAHPGAATPRRLPGGPL